MKIHFKRPARVAPDDGDRAVESWERQGLLAWWVRDCDYRMIRKENAHTLTSDASEVTCKHCLRFIEGRKQYKRESKNEIN